jgi:hypothetical protein
MAKQLKSGARVSWGTSQGKTTREVVKRVTRTARIKGHVAKALTDAPQYLVRSDKSGKQAIHKPKELKKR